MSAIKITRAWSAKQEPIADPAEESALIVAARNGDQAAVLRLFRAYLPTLAANVGRMTKSAIPIDDARQAAVIGLLNAIHAHAGRAPRLGILVREHANAAATEVIAGSAGYGVSTTVYKRFRAVLRDADNDPTRAEALIGKGGRHLSVGAFRDLYRLRARIPAEAGVFEEAADPFEAAEDLDNVRRAWAGLDNAEDRIVAAAIMRGDSDSELATRLGVSRVTALRRRAAVVHSMRRTLGVTVG